MMVTVSKPWITISEDSIALQTLGHPSWLMEHNNGKPRVAHLLSKTKEHKCATEAGLHGMCFHEILFEATEREDPISMDRLPVITG